MVDDIRSFNPIYFSVKGGLIKPTPRVNPTWPFFDKIHFHLLLSKNSFLVGRGGTFAWVRAYIGLNYCQAQHKLQLRWAELALFSLLDRAKPSGIVSNQLSKQDLVIRFAIFDKC